MEAKAIKKQEEAILKELRPGLDTEKPLIEIVDAENRKKEPLLLDDRVIKNLERKYGKRQPTGPFGE